MNLKRYVRDNKNILLIASAVYNFFMCNRIHRKVHKKGAFLTKVKIYDKGKNNKIYIGEGCRIYSSKIRVFGSNNTIIIENDCAIKKLDIYCSGGSKVFIGHNTHINGNTHLAATEGKEINIGARCLFASEITVRCGDSHSVLDLKGNRINAAKSVFIGEHCWIAQSVIILKGSKVGKNSVVGAGAVLTGKEYPQNSAVAGNPAKVIGEGQNINWYHKLL